MKTLRTKSGYQNWGYLFIAPWLLGFVLLQLYPLLASLFYSFTSFDLISAPVWAGLRNYIYAFTKDRFFVQSVTVTVVRVLFAVPAKLAFALAVALLLNSKVRGIGFYRTVFYLPSIFGGSVAIAILWRFLFMRDGLVNQFLANFGVPAIDWLGNPDTALFTVSLVTVWEFGSSMVLFLAGLKQVPEELYEAARIDGAGVFQRFFKITFPILTPIVFFNLIMQVINALQEFTTAFVITGGGPARSTYLYAMMIYDNGFKYLRMGYASALSWIMFLVIIILTALVFKSSPYWVFYNDGRD